MLILHLFRMVRLSFFDAEGSEFGSWSRSHHHNKSWLDRKAQALKCHSEGDKLHFSTVVVSGESSRDSKFGTHWFWIAPNFVAWKTLTFCVVWKSLLREDPISACGLASELFNDNANLFLRTFLFVSGQGQLISYAQDVHSKWSLHFLFFQRWACSWWPIDCRASDLASSKLVALSVRINRLD